MMTGIPLPPKKRRRERTVRPLAPGRRQSILRIREFSRIRALPHLRLIVRCILAFAAVLATPVIDDGICRLGKPFFIPAQILQHRGQKILWPIVCRMAERLQVALGHENPNLIGRKAEEPCGLFLRQPTRRAFQIQKTFNILLHACIPIYLMGTSIPVRARLFVQSLHTMQSRLFSHPVRHVHNGQHARSDAEKMYHLHQMMGHRFRLTSNGGCANESEGKVSWTRLKPFCGRGR